MAAASTDTKLQAFFSAVKSRTTSEETDALLVSLKIKAAELGATGQPNAAQFARDVYENAAVYSLYSNDTTGFERHYALAKSSYDGGLAKSEAWITIRGLYLMTLLVQNRLGEFHAELELLSHEDRKVPQIAFVISLEQYLAEGRYNKALTATRALPHKAFDVFVKPLVNTVRGEIADCTAASYDSLPVAAAQRVMKFDSEEELRAYVAEFQTEWTIEGDTILFNQEVGTAAQVPAKQLIINTLAYATELERIV